MDWQIPLQLCKGKYLTLPEGIYSQRKKPHSPGSQRCAKGEARWIGKFREGCEHFKHEYSFPIPADNVKQRVVHNSCFCVGLKLTSLIFQDNYIHRRPPPIRCNLLCDPNEINLSKLN